MPQYDNVSGVARQVITKYENVNGVARSVLKSYDNVSGVARQYFDSKVEPLVIYNYGDECTAITGGWAFGNNNAAKNCLDHCAGATGTKQKNSNHIYLGLEIDDWSTIHASTFTNNPINVTRYKTMHVLITEYMGFWGLYQSDGISTFSFRVHSEMPDPNVVYSTKTLNSVSHNAHRDGSINTREIEVVLDVSGISQAIYPVIMGVVYQCSTYITMKIHKVWFE